MICEKKNEAAAGSLFRIIDWLVKHLFELFETRIFCQKRPQQQ